MRSDAKYHFVPLVTLLGLILLLGCAYLFFQSARRFGQSQTALGDLPDPVLQAVQQHVGVPFALVQVDERQLPSVTTYFVRVEEPAGRAWSLWFAADGTPWPPESVRDEQQDLAAGPE